jgi:predicted O-linked N-acetylglucosamine transferase (SPINDLY family)
MREPFFKALEFIQTRKFEETLLLLKPLLNQGGDQAVIYDLIGRCYFNLGEVKAAEASFKKALQANPNFLPAKIQNTFLLPLVYESVQQIASWRERLKVELEQLDEDFSQLNPERAIEALDALTEKTLYFLGYQAQNDKEFQIKYGKLVLGLMQKAFPKAASLKKNKNGKIRVGFASSFFFDHSVTKLFKHFISDYDKNEFEVFVFDWNDRPDEVTEEIKSSVDHYYKLHVNRSEVIQAITEAELDVLIYPELGMDGFSYQIGSLKLAPVQGVLWGHVVTPGLDAIDYFFTSELMESENHAGHYSEKVIPLKGLGTCYTMPPAVASTLSVDNLGLAVNKVLVACTQTVYKYHPDFDQVLVKIAKQCPEVQFVFIESIPKELTQRLKNRLKDVFTAEGLNSDDFICFVRRLSTPEYIQLHELCELYLDTFYWSGFNTLMEALSVGIPFVTLPGEFFRGRHAEAVLKLLGMNEWIASTPDDYVSKAVSLIKDRDLRLQMKASIASKFNALCNRKDSLEDFYQNLKVITKTSS